MAADYVSGSASAQATSATATLTIDRPNSYAAGQVILLYVAAIGLSGTPACTDFTLLQTIPASNNIAGWLFGKVSTGTEAATYNVTNGSAPTGWTGHSFTVSGADTSSFPTSFEAGKQTAFNSSNSITVSGITMPADGLLLGMHVSRGTGATLSSSSGMTALWATDAFSSRTTRSYYEKPAAGATGDRIFASTASTTNVAGLYGINPAAAGGGSSVPPKAMYYSRTRAA